MNIDCKERERIFEDGIAEEWAAIESHAVNCAECAEEIRSWKSLSVAAKELREYSDSPALWERIETALATEKKRKHRLASVREWFDSWNGVGISWQTVAAGGFVLFLTVSSGWFYLRGSKNTSSGTNRSAFLRDRALNDVERTQAEYVEAIDKLAAEAKPQLDTPESPLLSSYREKLLLIDSAIDDLRAQAGNNPSNAHLRYQLLAMYQEKQQTLEEVLGEKR